MNCLNFSQFFGNKLLAVASQRFAVIDDEKQDPLGHPGWSQVCAKSESMENLLKELEGKDAAGHLHHEQFAFEVTEDENAPAYRIVIDTFSYEPEEISVHTDTHMHEIVVVGRKRDSHSGKEQAKGIHFVRKFFMSDAYDISAVRSKYESDGKLIIEAPRRNPEHHEHAKVHHLEADRADFLTE